MTSISLPLDDDGFLRRECPTCEREFKWHHGPSDDEPTDAVDPSIYYCPLCGNPAKVDSWWTQEQLDYIEQIALGVAIDELRDSFKRLERSSRGVLEFKASHGDDPEHPAPLHEPEDMAIVTSPCHAWEPVKIPSDWRQPLHCMLCGAAFSLD